MPLKQPVTRTLRLLVALAATCFFGGVTWYSFTRKLSSGLELLITVGVLALLWVLIRTGALPVPKGANTGPFGQPLRMRDILRFIGCVVGGFGWVLVMAVLGVPDTTAGAVILFGPPLLLFVIGMYFLGRALLMPFFSGPTT